MAEEVKHNDWDGEVKKQNAQTAQTAPTTPQQPTEQAAVTTQKEQATTTTQPALNTTPVPSDTPTSTPNAGSTPSSLSSENAIAQAQEKAKEQLEANIDQTQAAMAKANLEEQNRYTSRQEKNLRRNTMIKNIADALASVSNLYYTTKGSPSIDIHADGNAKAQERFDKLENMRKENYERYQKAYKDIQDMRDKRVAMKLQNQYNKARVRLAELKAQAAQEQSPYKLAILKQKLEEQKYVVAKAEEAVYTQQAATGATLALTGQRQSSAQATRERAAAYASNVQNQITNRDKDQESKDERRDVLNDATKASAGKKGKKESSGGTTGEKEKFW